MKALILGGSGFIGSWVQHQRPRWDWTTINTANCDLLDSRAVDSFQGQFDVVINASGFFGGLVFNQTHGKNILDKNLVMNVNIASLVKRLRPKKFVTVGSACVYPQSSDQHLSESMIGASDQYHESVKYSAQAKYALLQTMQDQDVPWEYLILSNVYGPGEHMDLERSHFVGSFINKIKNSQDQINMLGTGEAVRDFIYVEDAAEIICAYAERDMATCSPTNVGTGIPVSIRKVAEILLDKSRCRLPMVWGDARDNGSLYKVLDNSKLLQDTQIEFTPLELGLQKTWWYFA